MSTKAVAAVSDRSSLVVPAAYASSLTNRDDKDYKVTVIEGKAAKTRS